MLEDADVVHRPYRPAAFALFPELTVHAAWAGDWYWGRPTMEELRMAMRAITLAVRVGV